MLTPDLDMAAHFLNLLAPGEEFTFQTFDDNKERRANSGKYDPFAKVLHGTLDEYAVELIKLNQNRVGIFVMVNAGDGKVLDGAKTCRTRANVVRVRALFVDLDGAPIEPVQQHLTHPGIIVESSPERWHAYWLTDDCQLGDFKGAQQALIMKFDSDKSINDLPRVLRLPGFFHQKADPFQTRVVYPQETL